MLSDRLSLSRAFLYSYQYMLMESDRSSSSVNSNRPLSAGHTAIFQPASSLSSKNKLVFGLVTVLVIAISWVGSTQAARSTLSGPFKAPFFIVWVSTSCMMSVYPLVYLWYLAQLLYRRATSSSHDDTWCQYLYTNTASFLRYHNELHSLIEIL